MLEDHVAASIFRAVTADYQISLDVYVKYVIFKAYIAQFTEQKTVTEWVFSCSNYGFKILTMFFFLSRSLSLALSTGVETE